VRTITRFLLVWVLCLSFPIGANENAEIFEGQTIAISPSGKVLAVYWGDSISFFNVSDGKLLHKVDAETEDPFAFKFSADSSRLLSSGWEKVSIWDVVKGELMARVSTNDNAECAGFSGDGKNVYFDDEYGEFGFKQLAILDSSLADNHIMIRDTGNCKASPDRALLAIESFTRGKAGVSWEDPKILVMDTASTQTKLVLSGEKAQPYDEGMFFFDDNRKLLVRDNSDFHVWDLASGEVLRSWDSELDIDEITVSGNILLITEEEKIRVWHLLKEPGAIEIMNLAENYPSVLSVDLSNDGTVYAVTSLDESEENALISLFDRSTNALRHQIETQTPIYGVQFANDDLQVISTSYPIKVIDVSTGKVVHRIKK
jgi:WD40 repeat protein